MSAYRYLKAIPKSKTENVSKKKKYRWYSFGFLMAGTVLLITVAWPFLEYQLFSRADYSRKILSPTKKIQAQALGSDLVVDYSQPNSWFPAAPDYPNRPSNITHYTLSIPRLRIEQAVVEVGGQDLKKSLIHYSGTTLPGQYGNAVIFGHSTLPHFYNPKNYQAIFSTLPTLEKGDDVLINFDGITYRYRVKQLFEVKPEDVSVLTQNYDQRYLSLITCVPPGSYFRRLVVRAELR